MKIGRFENSLEVFYGIIENKKVLKVDSPFSDDFKVIGEYNLEDLKILPPTEPSKIICIGLNYTDHAKELGMDIPDEPIIFLKPPTSIIGDGDNIIYPEMSKLLHYEAELAVVIGKKCKNVKIEDSFNYILGFTCFNDVTARDLQRKDVQWTRAKSFDTFAPVGPWIVKKDNIEVSNLNIRMYKNGKIVQDSNTKNFIFKVDEVVSFISKIMTLLPGDIIATGTPPGVGEMNVGDEVVVEIEWIGRLRNKVVKEG
ncbi:MAG: 2-hydroxyhepta-2,4-diene-1,7-dioate isomerase [Caldiserica bacterium]|nr:MAG: 2-hydroxyhepta-2,4-diene-1,7-dioate isomerase [Caldisericota bacterium]